MENLDQLDPLAQLDVEGFLECLVYLDQKDTEAFLVWMEPKEKWEVRV